MTDAITEDRIITDMINTVNREDRDMVRLGIYALITICATACDKFKQLTLAKQEPTHNNVGITVEDVVENINKIKFADKRLQFTYNDRKHRQMLIEVVAVFVSEGMFFPSGLESRYLLPTPHGLFISANIIANTKCLDNDLQALAAQMTKLQNN